MSTLRAYLFFCIMSISGATVNGLPVYPSRKPPEVVFTQSEIARYAIRSIMGHPTLPMTVKKVGANYVVSYTRSDGRRFAYKVKFNKDIIVWGNVDGRWRDKQEDELVTYKIRKRRLLIEQLYGDGSVNSEVFTK